MKPTQADLVWLVASLAAALPKHNFKNIIKNFFQEDSVLIDEMMGVLKETIKSATVLFLVLDGGAPRLELLLARVDLALSLVC